MNRSMLVVVLLGLASMPCAGASAQPPATRAQDALIRRLLAAGLEPILDADSLRQLPDLFSGQTDGCTFGDTKLSSAMLTSSLTCADGTWRWQWQLQPFAPAALWQSEWLVSGPVPGGANIPLASRWPEFAARWRQWRAKASWRAGSARGGSPASSPWRTALQSVQPEALQDPAQAAALLSSLPPVDAASPQDCLDLGVMSWLAGYLPGVEASQACWQAKSFSKHAELQPIALALAGDVTAAVAELADRKRAQIALWPGVRLLLAQRAWTPLQRLLARSPTQSAGWSVAWAEVALAVAIGAGDTQGISAILSKLPDLDAAALDATVLALLELNAREQALVVATSRAALDVSGAKSIFAVISSLLHANPSGSATDLELRRQKWAELDARLPPGPAASWARAHAALALQREDEVAPLLSQLPADVLELAEARLLQAEAALATGRKDAALALAQDVVKQWPERVDALLVRARIQLDSDPKAAKDDLQRALDLAKADSQWHLELVTIEQLLARIQQQQPATDPAGEATQVTALPVGGDAVDLGVPTRLLVALGVALAATAGMLWSVLAGRHHDR